MIAAAYILPIVLCCMIFYSIAFDNRQHVDKSAFKRKQKVQQNMYSFVRLRENVNVIS